MNLIDIIIGALILFGLVRGLSKGLFVEVASLVALIAGVYGAIHFSDFAAGYLESRVEWDENLINITAFALTFIIIVIVIAMAGKALTKLADFAALGGINKILGGLFGALKTALILSVVLLVLHLMDKAIPFVDDDDLESSMLYEPVRSIAPAIFPYIIKDDRVQDEDDVEK